MTRRGYVTVLVIVSIGLLAVVLAAVAGQAAGEMRRVRMDAADAQASQLLAAAARVAVQQAADGNRANGPIDTPAGNVTLAWDGTAACVADVACDGTGRHARLVFDGARLVRVE